MKSEDVYWGLMHKVQQSRQVTGLSFDQVRFVVELIPVPERKTWLAWHEGLDEWLPLEGFKIFTQTDQIPRMSSPPFPPSGDVKGEVGPAVDDEVEVAGSTRLPPSRPLVDKRLTRRFQKSFTVQVTGSDGKVHKSETVNISSSGMLLASRLPESVGKTFSCIVSRDDGSQLKVFCALVRESGQGAGKSGSRLKFLDVSQPKVLLNWLIDSKTR